MADANKIAEELYEFEGRFGNHKGVTWKQLNNSQKLPYLAEGQFIIDEYLANNNNQNV